MAFVLDRVDDMRIIYETAKRVYSREITVDTAVKELAKKTDAKASSLQMYINIYACMRKGKVYKMGTSESFTQFLLENILRDEGIDAFTKALISVKSNAAYRASKDNAQPGLLRACKKAIAVSGYEIDFESLPIDYLSEKDASSNTSISKNSMSISEIDRTQFENCIRLENRDFSSVIMQFLAKYQILSDADLNVATNRDQCSELFKSSYPMLREINPAQPISSQIKDHTGRNRFYDASYVLNGRSFVMTSQLYGLGSSSTTRDNRLPFHNWIQKKIQVVSTSNTIKEGVFDSWEIIDESTAIKHCDKSFFDYRGSGVPKGICWFFDAEEMSLGETKTVKLIYNGVQYQGSVKNESTDRRRVRIFWSTELGNLFNAFNVPDAVATFKKITADTYDVSIKGGEKKMTIKEKVAAIKSYIAARGFNYEGDLIENFYLSLKSKPFVILAGTSGTGKTRLVKLFAEAIGAQMKLVPVRPDWSDSSDLFGHTDLSNDFHPGAIIDFIKQAEWNKDTPHFICLDEMNLARVEYYLSDILSIIETRDRKANGRIETDPLLDETYFKRMEDQKKYGRVYLPENLYIIGTVNMDETTFPFSKKVLDRANTIEFSFVNLMSRPTAGGTASAQKLDNSFLKTDYLYLSECDDEDLIDGVCFNLEELNQILLKANLHVGYRVRDEISFYMMNNKNADLLTEEAAFDHEVMQKILPRIQGSSAAIKDVLSELFIKCAGDYSGFAGAAAYEQMVSFLDSKPCKYPNSAKKIAFMMRRYEEDGFTSYWL